MSHTPLAVNPWRVWRFQEDGGGGQCEAFYADVGFPPKISHISFTQYQVITNCPQSVSWQMSVETKMKQT